MKIRYKKLPDLLDPSEYSYYPYTQVMMRYGTRHQPVLALVDSGAVDSIFPSVLGVLLDLDVPTGRRKIYFGIGGHSSLGIVHEVDLQVAGLSHWTKIEVGFLDSLRIPLLGQKGFFENYQIIFERFRYQFEIYPKIDALKRGRKGRRRP
jgi:hypothetical protein